jgi:hypothetical protein
MLFTLRFRPPVNGVQERFVEAKDIVQADAVGRKWCDTQAGYKFVSVGQAIVADASILGEDAEKKPARVGK